LNFALKYLTTSLITWFTVALGITLAFASEIDEISVDAKHEWRTVIGEPPAGATNFIINSETLDLVTLNVAHGRGKALNQILVGEARHRQNLDDVAVLFNQIDAHVIALQEADAPSLWSGGFDHVEYLSTLSGYSSYVHGYHADNRIYSFGAALLSPFLLTETASHAFASSPPTTTKGFVRATVLWQSGTAPARLVTLVSVHLDFSRRKVRDAQIDEMTKQLSGVDTPIIIMGDFNAEWTASDSPVREVAQEFGLLAYTPTDEGQETYKDKKRLDWILISEDLQFVDYAVLPDVVSDHLAVIAKIAWKTDR
jgi:endonuclease/exonuclease/phosphatase family metal-dependent hydrolase